MNVLSLLSIIFMTSLLSSSNNTQSHNCINVGESELTIRVLKSDISLDSIEVWVYTAPIFINTFENETYPLILKDGCFTGKIPTEMKEEVIGLSFNTAEKSYGRELQVRQGVNNIYEISIDPNFEIDWGEKPDFEGLTSDDWIKIHNSNTAIFSSHDLAIPKQKYADWRDVRNFEVDTLWPRNLAATKLSPGLPVWVENSLRCRFAAMVSIPYTKAAENIYGMEVAEPPMESYTFLDSISYTEDTFLKKSLYTGLKSFLYALLRFPEGGFEPIGDTPVDEWQDIARLKLSRAISNPTKLLLDLLSAMSYVEQIDIKQTPLTAQQIENVKAGYSDGLKDIILNKNSKLASTLENDKKLYKDITDDNFSLKDYIDKEYPGRPVIIDTWGTWCIPCLDAIAKTETIKSSIDSGDIIFLYIATDASPLDEWKKVAQDISGDHIRINDAATEKMSATYNLEVFPSYLFFSSSHDLLEITSGFPGAEKYKGFINALSGNK